MLWASDGTTGGTIAIDDAVVSGGPYGIGNPLTVAGPYLLYANDKIYTQSGAPNEQLMFCDTHGKSDPGAWTHQVINPYGNSFLPQAFAAYQPPPSRWQPWRWLDWDRASLMPTVTAARG